jgi:hypothetical protein
MIQQNLPRLELMKLEVQSQSTESESEDFFSALRSEKNDYCLPPYTRRASFIWNKRRASTIRILRLILTKIKCGLYSYRKWTFFVESELNIFKVKFRNGRELQHHGRTYERSLRKTWMTSCRCSRLKKTPEKVSFLFRIITAAFIWCAHYSNKSGKFSGFLENFAKFE